MSQDVQTARAPDEGGRLGVRLLLAGFAFMFAAAILMWFRFGPAIFMDLATAVVACF